MLIGSAKKPVFPSIIVSDALPDQMQSVFFPKLVLQIILPNGSGVNDGMIIKSPKIIAACMSIVELASFILV